MHLEKFTQNAAKTPKRKKTHKKSQKENGSKKESSKNSKDLIIQHSKTKPDTTERFLTPFVSFPHRLFILIWLRYSKFNFCIHFQPNRNMKAKQRERKVTKSVYTSPIHTHNTQGDTTPTHTETRHQHTVTQSLQISPPHTDPFHNFHSQRKLTHLTRSQTQIHKHTICVNSHLHTHVHKITSTHIHTPIYNSHAA